MTENKLTYKIATSEDISLLAEMNQQLIRDQKHRNKMTLAELKTRMQNWIQKNYTAIIFSCDGNDVGYALYRKKPNWIHLRQFFIKAQMRRKGIGREAISWLKANVWKEFKIIRVAALVNNSDGIAFWKAFGFKDYCTTMEMEN